MSDNKNFRLYKRHPLLVLFVSQQIKKKNQLIDPWLIDFNGMSNCFSLFYVQKLENRVHFMFIFTFFVLLFKSFFLNGPIEYE